MVPSPFAGTPARAGVAAIRMQAAVRRRIASSGGRGARTIPAGPRARNFPPAAPVAADRAALPFQQRGPMGYVLPDVASAGAGLLLRADDGEARAGRGGVTVPH